MDLSLLSDEELLDLRTKTTNEISKYNNFQQATKISLNSLYGAVLNRYFRWFNVNNGEAITWSGQLTIQWSIQTINEYLNKLIGSNKDYVIAGDTDSNMVRLQELVEKFILPKTQDPFKITEMLDKFCIEKLGPKIAESFEDLAVHMNAYKNAMHMKRECIASKGVFRAKKNYVLNVYNLEGLAYKEPKLKMVGIEAVKSSTPKICREGIKEAINTIMNADEEAVQEYIRTFKTEFKKQSFEAVGFPRGVTAVESYRDGLGIAKGTPIHSRAALVYNDMLKKHKLGNKYETIGDGDKIKFCYLKTPNPFGSNVIASPGELPKEFGAEQYIDYETQFEKTFLSPVDSLLKPIGWEAEKRFKLDDFFS